MASIINLQKRALEFSFLIKNSDAHFVFARHFSRSLRKAEFFYTSLLDKSTHKFNLTQIHSQLHGHGLQGNGFIITKLIIASAGFGEISYVRQVFDEFPNRYVFLWNAILRGYSMHNMIEKVIEVYFRMQHASVSPNASTFPYVLKACGCLTALSYGRAVHAQICRLGLGDDTFLQNGLLSFYLKCEEHDRGRVVFDRMSVRTVVSWTSIIT
ncbi:Pentatricopeptide repeat-containing protein [Striga hermonthica]|uniref:Pentatricopeptide repeat-containing protein n=1 Tax=Striga hermonthica TaxID=68872 RepID=A0A9N7NU36_STRHE|nr:Pentatricopeptide repeat-containing protein [Striga hermonthica]